MKTKRTLTIKQPLTMALTGRDIFIVAHALHVALKAMEKTRYPELSNITDMRVLLDRTGWGEAFHVPDNYFASMEPEDDAGKSKAHCQRCDNHWCFAPASWEIANLLIGPDDGTAERDEIEIQIQELILRTLDDHDERWGLSPRGTKKVEGDAAVVEVTNTRPAPRT